MKIKTLFTLLILSLSINSAWADSKLSLQKVSENIYAIVGELSNRSLENLGNNATFGFVVTSEGVVLIDSGATFNGAKAIKTVIETVTDKPVVKVINSGGQDHRWLGNDFFKKNGAEIIASEAAVKDQKARHNDQFFRLGSLINDKEIKLTEPVYANTTFKDSLNFKLGKFTFEIHHAGQAHTPGDSFIWMPEQKIMFTGDIVYKERILGIFDHSNSKTWLQTFEAMAAFEPKLIIPGHGKPTDLAMAKKDTYAYIKNLRLAVAELIDNDGDITEIGKIDQSKFSYLFNFEVLAGKNAQQVFTEMEWE